MGSKYAERDVAPFGEESIMKALGQGDHAINQKMGQWKTLEEIDQDHITNLMTAGNVDYNIDQSVRTSSVSLSWIIQGVSIEDFTVPNLRQDICETPLNNPKAGVSWKFWESGVDKRGNGDIWIIPNEDTIRY